MAAFCIACILTLAFIAPLSGVLKISICSFSIALPLFIFQRMAAEQKDVHKLTQSVAIPTYAVALVGWITLLWGIYWPAAIAFILAALISLAFVGHVID
jgi:hypothetical protein